LYLVSETFYTSAHEVMVWGHLRSLTMVEFGRRYTTS